MQILCKEAFFEKQSVPREKNHTPKEFPVQNHSVILALSLAVIVARRKSVISRDNTMIN